MANVTKVLTIAEYKTANNVQSIDIHMSKSGKRYGVVNGNAVMVAPDTKLDAPLFVVSMVDKATGETWDFMSNTQPVPLAVIATV